MWCLMGVGSTIMVLNARAWLKMGVCYEFSEV